MFRIIKLKCVIREPNRGSMKSAFLWRLISAVSHIRQKVRRISEEQQTKWQENCSRRRVKCTSGTACYAVNNYSIIASRGELARNNRAASETTISIATKKRTSPVVNGRIRSKEEEFARSGNLAEERSNKPKDSTRFGLPRSIQRGIIKSASVPKDLKEGALHIFQTPRAKVLHCLSFYFLSRFFPSCLISRKVN